MDKNLKTVEGRILCAIDLQFKNHHTFSNGQTIRLERQFNNLNQRETQPVSGHVLDAETIPKGAEILINHNAVHDTNRLFNHEQISGSNTVGYGFIKDEDVHYFSISIAECFFWRKDETDDWHGCGIYETALRLFKPYAGILQGIEPKIIPDTLYVTSGDLKGQVVKTLRAADYEIIYREKKTGQESNIIRFRPHGDYTGDIIAKHREPEAIAIMHELTEQVNNGLLYVGLSKSDCKPIKDFVNA